MGSKYIVKLQNFIKKHKTKIVLILVVWGIIVIINYVLQNMPKEIVPKTSYTPHVAVITNNEVPKKLQEPIENLIDKYMEYCNNKDYENAYNMLGQSCKSELYPTIDSYKEYVDSVFEDKRIYAVQNYSNIDSTYIYEIRIMEDILKTGLTGKTELEVYPEKIIIKEESGELKLSINGFIGTEETQNVYEDDYIKVSIEKIVQNYETQVYTVRIANKTEHTIVLQDGSETYEIVLSLQRENRKLRNAIYGGVVLVANQSKTYQLEFTKFVDEDDTAQSLVFNAVRVLEKYTGRADKKEEELANAVKLYSFQLKLTD
ncbi:MAG: hypothetical protein LBL91_04290 [Lachnospiraceae bacterium]|jgi:hypothetical protein|nr:hypothetical protein [Lachnospiraceae bacterium]